MALITKTDIEDKFGIENVLVWSDLENTGTIDLARISRAINYAEARINDELRNGPYAIPLVPNGPNSLIVIVDIAAVIAGWWLLDRSSLRDENALNRIKDQKDEAIDDLAAYRNREKDLDVAISHSAGNAPAVV